tara:strand:+ start:6280 stop:6441 length:162 start_codon:yes stop_codon:yes gene_type:complete
MVSHAVLVSISIVRVFKYAAPHVVNKVLYYYLRNCGVTLSTAHAAQVKELVRV